MRSHSRPTLVLAALLALASCSAPTGEPVSPKPDDNVMGAELDASSSTTKPPDAAPAAPPPERSARPQRRSCPSKAAPIYRYTLETIEQELGGYSGTYTIYADGTWCGVGHDIALAQGVLEKKELAEFEKALRTTVFGAVPAPKPCRKLPILRITVEAPALKKKLTVTTPCGTTPNKGVNELSKGTPQRHLLLAGARIAPNLIGMHSIETRQEKQGRSIAA